MSRNPRASSSSSKPLIIRATHYHADARQRQVSGRKSSRAVSSTTVKMVARTGIVEDLMNPPQHQSRPTSEPIAESLENDDWVDVEPEEAPPISKN
ncbi:hypothetical protein FRC09_008871, partial [Ceratobasidium sp. 395]